MSDQPIECSKETATFMRDVINAAISIGLDSLLFRKGLVSGMGGKLASSVVLCHNHDLDLDFDVFAVTRLGDLKQRLTLVTEDGKINLHLHKATIAEDDPMRYDIIGKLAMSLKRMKLSFIAAPARAVKAPKRVGFNYLTEVSLDTAAVDATLSNANRALSTDASTLVALSCSNGELTASVTDVNNDIFEDVLAGSIEASFSHRYFLNYFLALIKQHDKTTPIKVSKEGILQFNVNGFTVYQLPRIL